MLIMNARINLDKEKSATVIPICRRLSSDYLAHRNESVLLDSYLRRTPYPYPTSHSTDQQCIDDPWTMNTDRQIILNIR